MPGSRKEKGRPGGNGAAADARVLRAGSPAASRSQVGTHKLYALLVMSGLTRRRPPDWLQTQVFPEKPENFQLKRVRRNWIMSLTRYFEVRLRVGFNSPGRPKFPQICPPE